MWSGYLRRDPRFQEFADAFGLSLEPVHTSGHAALADLQRLANALSPRAVVPIHTAAAGDYRLHFPNVVELCDGESFPVPGREDPPDERKTP
jgi:ribonuclease J